LFCFKKRDNNITFFYQENPKDFEERNRNGFKKNEGDKIMRPTVYGLQAYGTKCKNF
jgi:hypothetical protein